jgi:CRISPR-associated protein Csm4
MGFYKKKMVRLRFTAPLHIGTGKSENYDHSDELIHSDTIKSALYVVFRQVYPELAQKDDGSSFFDAFTVSSAFPYYDGELFLPKPLAGFAPVFSELKAGEDSKLSKRSKRIQFVGLKIFEKWLHNAGLQLTEKQLDQSKRFLFSSPQNEPPKVFTREVQQRVYIPPRGEDEVNTQPYYIERIYFHQKAGLYFLLDCSDEALLQQLEVCLLVLGDQGFGTDKNVGNGQFEFQITDFTLELPDDATHQMSLGLFCPQQSAVAVQYLADSAFSVGKRGGFIVSAQDVNYRHFRKKSVYMFTEGSIFPAGMPVTGKRVDLKPETVADMHPVWRDGNCLFIPIKIT